VREPCTTYTSSRLDYDPFGMLTVGRSWSVGSEYRYGFNSAENDDEIAGNNNDLDFGARIYDSRLGRWLSIDPKANIYSSFSPYSFCLNNPVVFVDENGKEPTRLMAGTIEEALSHFRDKGLTTVDEIIEYIDYATKAAVNHYDEVPGMDDDVEGFVRYVYTEEKGWIDLYHYFNAAKTSEEAMDVFEAKQLAEGEKSAFSYEDLPSNNLGGDAPLENDNGEDLVGDELFDAVAKHFYEVKSTEPENAPNWNLIPAERSRREPPRNYSNSEINYENFPPAEDSMEKKPIVDDQN